MKRHLVILGLILLAFLRVLGYRSHHKDYFMPRNSETCPAVFPVSLTVLMAEPDVFDGDCVKATGYLSGSQLLLTRAHAEMRDHSNSVYLLYRHADSDETRPDCDLRYVSAIGRFSRNPDGAPSLPLVIHEVELLIGFSGRDADGEGLDVCIQGG